jgi:hypothetical protein
VDAPALLENERAESDQVLEHPGTAFRLYLNFSISGMERLVREVPSALRPRSARTCGGKNTSRRRYGPRNGLEAGRGLTAPYDGCIRLENLAPSIHNGKIAAQKVFPA